MIGETTLYGMILVYIPKVVLFHMFHDFFLKL